MRHRAPRGLVSGLLVACATDRSALEVSRMKPIALIALALPALLLYPTSSARSQKASHSFSFEVKDISGFPSGKVFLTGGGAYDPESGFLHTGGGFRCLEDINQGPLSGCKAGERIRWVASEVLASTGSKCS